MADEKEWQRRKRKRTRRRKRARKEGKEGEGEGGGVEGWLVNRERSTRGESGRREERGLGEKRLFFWGKKNKGALILRKNWYIQISKGACS